MTTTRDTDHGILDIGSTYLHLGEPGTAVPLTVGKTFWQDLGQGAFAHLGPGRLVSQFVCTEDWPSWEMHPDGEEIVMLLSGRAELVLDTVEGEMLLTLEGPGAYAIVPRGTWHTANVAEPASMLFITPGEGTQHRPR